MVGMSLDRSGGQRGAGKQPNTAKKQHAKLRFGPAGWMYKDWEGIVYPLPKSSKFDQLRYIADFFDTVEINSSFYGPPVARTAASWVKRVKEHDFRFTAKFW